MKKVHKCLICGHPTVASNRLCKSRECLAEQLKRRMHIVPDKKNHESGVFMSLTRCTHNVSLEEECAQCDIEWQEAQGDR